MNRVDAAQRSDDGVWESTERQAKDLRSLHPLPASARVLRLDEAALDRLLGGVQGAGESPADNPGAVISLPMPDGSFERFRVRESPVMEPALAAEHPDIKSYRGQGVDNRLLTMRCNRTPQGFYAMITDGAETVTIEAVASRDARAPREYVSYYGRDYATIAARARCAVKESEVVNNQAAMRAALAASNPATELTSGVNYAVGDKLISYRIAIATTTGFTFSYGSGIGPLTTLLTAVNVIFERELSVHLSLIANNSALLNSSSFTNGNPDLMVDQARQFLKSALTESAYDLGHVLGTGSGGKAYIGVVCDANADGTGLYKAGGATLLSGGGVANSANVAAFAHELGHQFGAMHSFNATTGGCSGTRFGDSAVESGSGLTIMSLAGSCGTDTIASGREARFHAGSFEEIVTYLNFINGLGGSVSETFNSIPAVNGGPDYTIPKNTPFKLSATGSDANGDPLTYTWEQMDPGASAYANPAYGDAGDAQNTTRPIFRPFAVSSDATRTFPSLSYILNNANVPPATAGGLQTAENLPSVTRALNFRVTVRDNRDFGGGVNSDSVKIDVDGGKGPFAVTAPNTAAITWPGGTQQTITWARNGAELLAANVRILLSTDGGNTFPTILAGNTANDGSEVVTVPSVNTATARIKVEAIGNIFFDISDANFTIGSSCSYAFNPASQSVPAVGGSYSTSVTAGAGCSWTASASVGWITITSGSGSGSGAVQYTVANNLGLARSGTVTIPGATLTINQAAGGTIVRAKKSDFDGDGKTDLAVWNGPVGDWFYLKSSNNQTQTINWGTSNSPYLDVAAPGDFDGDGKTDPSIFRRQTATWYVLKSSDGGYIILQQGLGTDTPVPGDYDGDGKTDLAVWRGSTGDWIIRRSSDNATQTINWGSANSPNFDVPVQGDYDGDGKTDLAVWRPGNGTWYVLRSSNGAYIIQAWGAGYAPYNDIPVTGDYDGDGKNDFGIWRQSDLTWYIQPGSGAAWYGVPHGASGDLHAAGDYDGDGKTDVGVWRPSNGAWYVIRSSNGTLLAQAHGQSGNTPIPNVQR